MPAILHLYIRGGVAGPPPQSGKQAGWFVIKRQRVGVQDGGCSYVAANGHKVLVGVFVYGSSEDLGTEYNKGIGWTHNNDDNTNFSQYTN